VQVPKAAAGARILVVDDEPYIVEMLSLSLRFLGFKVASAGTGRGPCSWPARSGQTWSFWT
jgi:two-component system, OmpR family, response regulator